MIGAAPTSPTRASGTVMTTLSSTRRLTIRCWSAGSALATAGTLRVATAAAASSTPSSTRYALP
jgi:hypothetical protein